MALFDNIINKYFKTPDPGESSVDDLNVSATKDKAETTAESNATEQSGGTINPYSQVGEEKAYDGNLRFTMPQAQPSYNQGVGAYEQLWEKLYGGVEGEPESQEDIEKREKRERRNSNIFALADALGGVANIWGSIKGATPMDLSSLSEANKKRYDYAKDRRERNQEAWRRGMFNARANDMNALAQSEQERLKAAERAAAQVYREKQDEIKQGQWLTKYLFDIEQARERAELEAAKLVEQKRKNLADEKIRQRTVALAEKQSSSRGPNTGATIKTAMFALSDGKSIHVPEDLKYDYYADVYDVLSREAEKKGDNTIIDFMNQSQGIGITKSSVMRDAVHLYGKKYPEVEKYMIKRAEEYMNNYDSLPVAKDMPAPGSPGSAKVPINSGVMAGALTDTEPALTEDDLLDYLID